MVWVAKHFRPYLYGHKSTVYTDNEALKSLLNTPQPSGKLARWGMALQELDLTIQHRSGKSNNNADALSRFPLPTSTDLDCGGRDFLSVLVRLMEPTFQLKRHKNAQQTTTTIKGGIQYCCWVS